jgi:adenine-specific DNA-methyltransferase
MTQKYTQLKSLLRELFQLDQPDLDFGLYRVMHAKADEVTQFLEKDLLPQVQAAFGQYKTADKAEIEKELAKAIDQANALGADPETLPKVKELRGRLANDAVNVGQLENEVYDHLFSFFRRYYSEGDFLAKRVYKPGVYAIPYEGEEVTLHWANKDQYYIKTSEYLRDYAFRLRPEDDKNPMRVHFRLADAAEGEHGNVKAAEGKDRVFILATRSTEGEVLSEEAGPDGPELTIRFEYRPATLTDWPDESRAGKAKPPAQKDLIAIAAKRILAIGEPGLASWITALGKPHVTTSGEKADYSRLEAHLRRYTARNTFDYFIHKDLGGFLRRELDFYIKNEVMHLDDVESETAPRVEQYLSKIKVVRKIAGKIIDFLAQLEDFQKKLWLKKKFVVETQYCITVGSIPEEFYAEIAANDAQRQEWVQQLSIDKVQGTLTSPGYSAPLHSSFLSAFPTLMIDTRHFDAQFSDRLLATLGDTSAITDGVLFHSDNFHALRLANASLSRKVKCIYIDPPYNTGSGDFSYKDSYQHSSWLSMMSDRLRLGEPLLSDDGFLFGSIDDNEVRQLATLMTSEIGGEALPTITWEKRTKAQNTTTARQMLQSKTEYVLGMRTGRGPQKFKLEASGAKTYPLSDTAGPYRLDPVGQMAADGMRGRRTMIYPIRGVVPRPGMQWKVGKDEVERLDGAGRLVLSNGEPAIVVRPGDEDEARYAPFWSHFFDKDVYGTAEVGSAEVRDDLGFGRVIETVKPTRLLHKLLSHCTDEVGAHIVDYFAGSGTTGHAIISLNREDGGGRRFILVEMADYFDRVLLPRVKKVTYSPEWADGTPTRAATREEANRSPRIVKVVRLESYEDTLNNLDTRRSSEQQMLLTSPDAQGADGLKEQYTLRYMLNVETRGSQSLLNVQAFRDPTAYTLKVKCPGSDESREVNVDLLETFNWLVGLTVKHIAAPQTFAAECERDSEKRLRVKGRLKQDAAGPHWFRTVTGTTPDGRKALVIWRKLTTDPEQDNLVLDEWFAKQGYSSKDSEFDVIWVNGGNNLENLKTPDDRWKVRLIEEDFHRLMFDTEGV